MSTSLKPLETIPALEEATLRDCTLGEPALVQEILDLYKEDVPKRLQRASLSLQNNQFSEFHFEIHSIKGSSGSIGARQMEEVAKAMIELLKEERGAECEPLFEQLQQTFTLFLDCYNNLQERQFKL